MCDPISGVMAVSAGVSLFGGIKSGNAAKKAGSAQRAAYEKTASQRLEKVQYDVALAERSHKRQTGEAYAAMGTTGISRTSFYDVLADSAAEQKLEIGSIVYTGKNEAEQLRSQGAIAYQSGKDAQTASYIGAASGALNALSGVKLGSAFQTSGGWQTTTTNSAGQII
jgi:hypothetical protein